MRILITTILVWAILLGFFATGVKVMATSPQVLPIQAVETVSNDNLNQVNMMRDSRNIEMRSAD